MLGEVNMGGLCQSRRCTEAPDGSRPHSVGLKELVPNNQLVLELTEDLFSRNNMIGSNEILIERKKDTGDVGITPAKKGQT